MMEEPEHREPIPKEFYCYETGEPFKECIECGKNLLDGQPYLIEKAFRNHVSYKVRETIYDYALCMECAETLRNEMSQESIDAITRYFSENIDLGKQFSMTHLPASENISRCMITGKVVDECEEYQIYAYCRGSHLSMEIPPYMVSGEVMEEILPLLSKKTTDDLNGFFNKHFSPDPSLMEPIGPKLILV